MAGALGKFSYVSDDGTTYKVRIDASNAAVTNAGFTGTTGRPNLPGGYSMRHVWAVDDTDTTGGRTPTGRRRLLYCGTAAATVWTGGDTAVTLDDFSVSPSVPITWNVESYVGEQRYAR